PSPAWQIRFQKLRQRRGTPGRSSARSCGSPFWAAYTRTASQFISETEALRVRSLVQPAMETGVKRTPFHEWPCSVARTVDLLGDWWTPLVIREAFLGATRFEEFQKGLSIGRNVLTQRLSCLVAEGLLERRQYHDKP